MTVLVFCICHARGTLRIAPFYPQCHYGILKMEYIEAVATSGAQTRLVKNKTRTLEWIKSWYMLIENYCFSIDLFHSLCCQCGVLTTPNPSNMCVGCLRSQVDITEGIPKQSNLCFCKACERWEEVFNPLQDSGIERVVR